MTTYRTGYGHRHESVDAFGVRSCTIDRSHAPLDDKRTRYCSICGGDGYTESEWRKHHASTGHLDAYGRE